MRWYAVEALSAFADARAVEPLIGALADPDKDVRRAVVDALPAFADARAGDALIGALRDQDTDVRSAAVHALRALGDPRAVGAVIGAYLEDLADSRRAEDAMWLLEAALQRSSQAIDAELLHRVCKLQDDVPTYTSLWALGIDSGDPGESGVVSSARVKQLARQELIRRGLPA